MSRRIHNSRHRHGGKAVSSLRRAQAPLFAAFGDPTRLTLVARLSAGPPHSISQLTTGSRLTRQAITKHLRVLQNAGVVRNVRIGRERLFTFDPQPVADMQRYLAGVSHQWDQALLRLKSFVERPETKPPHPENARMRRQI